ncbi:PREDICTED: paramyosin-like [Amphimedon queenslandica]|uniref:Uncharacterized protein n=1 Tax=Amphimedon queenslandica TaxID=400682 RepID=A0A1X7SEJ2_AMPQE|nr:PREDICTED: paramyosin-like [Amphimedon queenslandica]|eukprot:XP_019864133.1 PREDICTED: paramyosin-like [Amphimedon queenslandica]
MQKAKTTHEEHLSEAIKDNQYKDCQISELMTRIQSLEEKIAMLKIKEEEMKEAKTRHAEYLSKEMSDKDSHIATLIKRILSLQEMLEKQIEEATEKLEEERKICRQQIEEVRRACAQRINEAQREMQQQQQQQIARQTCVTDMQRAEVTDLIKDVMKQALKESQEMQVLRQRVEDMGEKMEDMDEKMEEKMEGMALTLEKVGEKLADLSKEKEPSAPEITGKAEVVADTEISPYNIATLSKPSSDTNVEPYLNRPLEETDVEKTNDKDDKKP